MDSLFLDLGYVIIASGLVGAIGYFLKQPSVISYILAGIILGPAVTGIIGDYHFIENISHIGIVLMLFLIGLEMSTSRLRDMGKAALSVGIGQVVITVTLAFGLLAILGQSGSNLLYLATAMGFSSTVIAIKLLAEKRDLSSYYGQITVGTLLVQDILAILAMVILTGVASPAGLQISTFLQIFGGGLLLGVSTILFSRYFLSALLSKIANSSELLILASLAWCFVVAMFAKHVGLSMEIGAFIAGVNLANLPYTFEINAKSKPIRDFFVTLFFVALGMSTTFPDIGAMLLPAILCITLVLIGNPIIVMTIMGLMGYDKRNSFFTGLAIANISEFSLILLAMGAKFGQVDPYSMSLMTIVSIVTMMLSSYMITYNTELYNVLKPYLRIFERKRKQSTSPSHCLQDHVVLLGYDDTGKTIFRQLRNIHDNILVVDHNNAAIKSLIAEDIPCIFGDVEDEELLDELHLDCTKIVITTLPNPDDNYYIFKRILEMPENRRPILIAVAENGKTGLDLFVKGADYVIVKSYLGASQVYAMNKELYDLPANGTYVLSEILHDPSKNKYATDVDYATFLDQLNNMRMTELKARISASTKSSKTPRSKQTTKYSSAASGTKKRRSSAPQKPPRK